MYVHDVCVRVHVGVWMWVCATVHVWRVSLCSAGCPGTHSVNQASLELRGSTASAS